MRRQQDDMSIRMLHQEDELRRRQQENTMFMQVQGASAAGYESTPAAAHQREYEALAGAAILPTEQELCSILREYTLLPDFSKTNTKSLKGQYVVELPTPEDMLCEERQELERIKDRMEYKFIKYKHELQTLLNECDVPPLPKPEHYAYSLSEQESDPSVTKKNLELLKASTEEYRNNKKEFLAEKNHFKEEITLLSKKMLKNQEEIQSFLDDYKGLAKSTLAKLKENTN